MADRIGCGVVRRDVEGAMHQAAILVVVAGCGPSYRMIRVATGLSMARRVIGMRLVIAAMMMSGCSDGSGGATTGGATTDGGVKTDAPAAQIDAPAAQPSSVVSVFKFQGTSYAVADASFGSQPTNSTTLGTVGACTAVETTLSSTPGLSAGVVTVTTDLATATLVPSGNPPMYEAPLPRPPFSPEATVSASATGSSDVPAFALHASAPSDIEGYITPSSISRSAGYTATWTAGNGQDFLLTIRVPRGETDDVLQCDVPDTGSYAVPASALGYLGTGSGSTPVTMQLRRSGTATDSASGVELLVTTAVSAQVPFVP